MNRIRLLSRLDRWLGVPLCGLASALRRLGPRTSSPSGPPRRILFIGLAEMGAAVLADAAMREAAARFGASAYFLTFAANRQGLALTGSVPAERCFGLRLDRPAHALADLWRFLRWARRAGIDAVVDLEPCSRASSLIAWATGAPRRSGFAWPAATGPYRGALYTHPVAYDESIHIRDNFLRLLRALAPTAGRVAFLSARGTAEHLPGVEAATRRRVLRRLAESAPDLDPVRQPLVLLHANVTDPVPQRRWPRARWVALARRLTDRQPDLQLLLIGGADEGPAAGDLAREIGRTRCASVAGAFAVAELPALFALARVLVSSDSGPVHFAAATGLPVVALFGPETPQRYGPLGPATVLYAGIACSPCLKAATDRQTTCPDNRCMQALTVDEVAEAVAGWLGAGSPATADRQPVERVA